MKISTLVWLAVCIGWFLFNTDTGIQLMTKVAGRLHVDTTDGLTIELSPDPSWPHPGEPEPKPKPNPDEKLELEGSGWSWTAQATPVWSEIPSEEELAAWEEEQEKPSACIGGVLVNGACIK